MNYDNDIGSKILCTSAQVVRALLNYSQEDELQICKLVKVQVKYF